MRTRILLLLASTIVALAVVEAATRTLGLSKTWNSYGAAPELNLRDSVTGEPVGFTRVPGTTWKMPRGLMFTANANGFRDRPFAERPTPGVVRIAFLGDSVTEGYGVEEPGRFSNVAASILNERGSKRYEQLNFGVVGQSTADEFVVLTRHALKFGPAIVVLQVGWNDFAENARKLAVIDGSTAVAPVQSFAPPPQSSRGFRSFLQQHSALYLALAERASVWRLRRGGANPILARIAGTSPVEWQATERILTMFADACHAASATPMVAYFPMDVEVLTADEASARFASNRIAQIAAKVHAVAIDELGALRRANDRNLYLDDVHLTELGHRIAAEAIARTIEHRGESRPD